MASPLGVLDAVGVIPARYASTRFPGKPLALIAGVPMVVRVARQVLRCQRLSRVLVATDDPRIVEVCVTNGIEAVMTSSTHRSGTDRLAEVALARSAALYVNVQGDEPLVDPDLVDSLIEVLSADPSLDMATAAREVTDSELVRHPDIVTLVTDLSWNALYFSRSPIPWSRGGGSWLRHVGIYAYRREALLRLARLPPSPLEIMESLEQLRALSHGMRIRVVLTEHESVGVDSPGDVGRVEALLTRADEVSSPTGRQA